MLTAKEAAAALDGNQIGKEGGRELWAEMKAAGLVAVFGASDDLMEFRGAVYEEASAFDTTQTHFTGKGLLASECDDDRCPYFAREMAAAVPVIALWCAENGISWTYQTEIPHETFRIMEDGETYCRGIVFALADVPAK